MSTGSVDGMDRSGILLLQLMLSDVVVGGDDVNILSVFLAGIAIGNDDALHLESELVEEMDVDVAK